MQTFQRHILASTATVKEAIEGLNRLSGDAMTLIVTDASGRPVGTVTDGDIRRALLRGVTLDDNVERALMREFRSVRRSKIDVALVREMRKLDIRLLPVIDDDGRLVEIVDLRRVKSLLPLSALIMAGGKGERLRPMTLTTPKPLLEIEGKAIIDYNIEALAHVGVKDVTVSTAYLAEQLDEHFSVPVAGINVRTLREVSPRGTIGALADALPDMVNDTILVMNSDLLTDIALDEMYMRHTGENADITVAAIPYTVSVPYAILSTEGSRITSLQEKPTYSLYANGGIYIISRLAAGMVPRDRRYDATDLIEDAIARGLKVVYFPINGTWIDVGTPADFRHAADIMKYHGSKQP
ncbi:MAG: NTP transferase domain-containing protein [Muribaculaceae bacterium]|nr:NTP transferase domain-containing protein [Muribaculaceae bacterium]